MNLFQKKSRIIVTCSNRLSPFLQKEIETLGFRPRRIFKTGVELEGTIHDCIILNLHLHCASQVLFSVRTFRAPNAEMLYRDMLTVEWENIIPANGYFSITSNVSNETITNNLFANVRLKDAIADRFRNRTGSRPDSGAELSGVVVHLYWKDDLAELFIDTSGETLSKHGYRKIPGKAPMLESLAAAAIIASRWDSKSHFINPMCGSGTLAIEAALMASGRKPGLFRSNYSFMHLCGYDEEAYLSIYKKIESGITDKLPFRIIASDISEDAVSISKVNAGIAGVESLMEFECVDFEKTTIPAENKGMVIFNPEYGDRLGDELELEGTYKRLGDFLKKQCKGYWGYIFTGNLELSKKIGLRPSRRIEFYNGKIDCRLFEYELYEGSRSIR